MDCRRMASAWLRPLLWRRRWPPPRAAALRLAIEAETFDMGAPLSEPVARAIDAVVTALCRELETEH